MTQQESRPFPPQPQLYTITYLVGEENTSSISLNALPKEYYMLELRDKMLNISSETPRKHRINTDIIKAVISGDLVTAREPYKQPTKFKSYAKHFLAMNEFPLIDDNSYGWLRRLFIIEFPRTFGDIQLGTEGM